MPKTLTISHETAGWYACFSCEGVPIQPLPLTGKQISIDLGLETFATLSDGSQIANPRILRLAERRLKRAQRRVSRRVKGRHRRRKAVRLLARARRKVRRARADFHHKATTRQRSLWSGTTTPSIMRICRRPTCSGTTISRTASRMQDGARS
jgi:putative transposase